MPQEEISTPQRSRLPTAGYNVTPLTSTPERHSKLSCCFPGLFFHRKKRHQHGKQVRFASIRGKSGVSNASTLKRGKTSRSLSGDAVGSAGRSTGSPSKKSFYSAISKMTHIDPNNEEFAMSSPATTAVDMDGTTSQSKDRVPKGMTTQDLSEPTTDTSVGVVKCATTRSPDNNISSCSPCLCGFRAHREFDPQTPLVIPPGVEPGSRDELMVHARAMVGRWVTVLERSDSLDPQMVYVGIGKMKRMVMNRLAIPLAAELIDNDETLKVWIETPVGNKVTSASLVGKETFDKDADLGDWSAKSYITDYATPLFCQGREFRALQMDRKNPKLGTAFETKAVLPDQEFNRILLYNITIHPPNNGNVISVNRIYRPEKM